MSRRITEPGSSLISVGPRPQTPEAHSAHSVGISGRVHPIRQATPFPSYATCARGRLTSQKKNETVTVERKETYAVILGVAQQNQVDNTFDGRLHVQAPITYIRHVTVAFRNLEVAVDW